MLISPSPTINGFGGAGTSVPTTDVYSSYYNPAQIQLPNGFSLQISNSKTDWLPNLADDIDYNYGVSMFGYNGDFFNNYNFQASIANSKILLNVPFQGIQNSFGIVKFSSIGSTFSFGIGNNKFPIFLSAGITYKEVKQEFKLHSHYDWYYEEEDYFSKNNFHDWGLKFSLYDYNLKSNFMQLEGIIDNIALNYSFGYSKSNIGDRIYYSNSDDVFDLPPTTSRLGMTFGGSFFIFDDFEIEFKLIREAEDLMLEYDNSLMETVPKDGYLGDIDIAKHIFKGKADRDVVIHKGSEVTFSKIISIRAGYFIDLDGSIECKTSGLGINIDESIKILSKALSNQIGINLFDYINLKYNYSFYSLGIGHPLNRTKFNELTLSLNFPFF